MIYLGKAATAFLFALLTNMGRTVGLCLGLILIALTCSTLIVKTVKVYEQAKEALHK